MLFCMLHSICCCLPILYPIHFLLANFTVHSLYSCWVWKREEHREREEERKREIKQECDFASFSRICIGLFVCVFLSYVIHVTSFSRVERK